jgi:biopolymer transport protein ExbD
MNDSHIQPLFEAKQQDGLENNMIPLINVVFLLLIFFMVASHISQSIDVNLPEVENHNVDQTISNPKGKSIHLMINKSGSIVFENQIIQIEQLKHELNSKSINSSIKLFIDKEVTAKMLDPILMLLAQVNVDNTSIVITTK